MTYTPYQRHSGTSRAGAVAAAPKAPSQREVIVAYVREHGPCTRTEISRALGQAYPINVVTARVSAALYDKADWRGRITQPAELQRWASRLCTVTGHEAETVIYKAPKPVQGGLL